MASPVGHSLVGVSAWLLAWPRLHGRPGLSVAVLAAAVALANLPDLDILLAVLDGDAPRRFHRMFSHSLLFAVLAGGVMAALGLLPRPSKAFAGAGLAARTIGLWSFGLVASHLLLDLFAVDRIPPYGIPLWLPFSGAYVISPWTPLPDVHFGTLSDLLSPAVFFLMWRDALWLWPLPLAAWLSVWRSDLR